MKPDQGAATVPQLPRLDDAPVPGERFVENATALVVWTFAPSALIALVLASFVRVDTVSTIHAIGSFISADTAVLHGDLPAAIRATTDLSDIGEVFLTQTGAMAHVRLAGRIAWIADTCRAVPGAARPVAVAVPSTDSSCTFKVALRRSTSSADISGTGATVSGSLEVRSGRDRAIRVLAGRLLRRPGSPR